MIRLLTTIAAAALTLTACTPTAAAPAAEDVVAETPAAVPPSAPDGFQLSYKLESENYALGDVQGTTGRSWRLGR